MIRASRFVAVAGLWASACPAAFHPRENAPYRYDVTEKRTADGVSRWFRATRSVVFHRVPDGYEAIVTLQRTEHGAGVGVGAMFETAMAALRDRPIRYHIDAAGHVTSVADADALVALIADAIERGAANTRERTGTAPDARALSAPLRNATPERKTAMLLSMLQPLLFAETAAAGTRPVTLPSRPPLPSGAVLTGTETVTRRGDIMIIAISATGGPAGGVPQETPGARFMPATAPPALTVTTTHTVNCSTGLLIEAREASDTLLPGEDGPRHALTETITRLSPAMP